MATNWSEFTPVEAPAATATPTPTPAAVDWSSFKPVVDAAPAKPAAEEPGLIARTMESLKPKPGSELGYLGAALERGWNGLNLAVNGLKLSEYGELVEGIRKSYTPEQIAADPKLQEELRVREEGFARLAQENAQLSKANQAILESDRSRPETKQMLGVGTKDRGWLDSAADFGKAMVKDPGSVVDLALSSGPSSLASMATAAITYFGTRNPALAAAAGGAGSGYIEFGNEYSENREQGMAHDEAWKAAALKSGVVGALDAVSMNTAGKALNTVAEAMRSGATKTALKTVGTETAKQGALGGLGEAGGSLAAGKEVDPTNVLAEVVGEMVSAPVEAVSTRGKLATAITPEAQIARAIDENVANAQWVAPAQEVARDRLSPYSMEPTTQFVQNISPKPLDTSSITAAGTVDDALVAAEGLAGTLNVEMPAPTAPLAPPVAPIAAQAPEALEPIALTGEAPAMPAVAGALPRLTDRATDEDLLGRVVGQTPGLTAPRPQRIQGTPVANLTDDQLTQIANDEAVPAITRRGASVELTARQAEAAPTIPANEPIPGPTSPAVGQPVAQGGTAPALGGVTLGAPELAQQPAAQPQPVGTLDTPEGAASVGLTQPLTPAKTASARNVGKTIELLKSELSAELPPDPVTGEAPELDIRQYSGPLTEAQQAASALGRVMGKTVTFLAAAPGQLPNGLVVTALSANDVYLASDASAPVIGVAVHEITHLMPEPLKAKLNAGLRSLFNEQYLGEFAADRRLDIQNKALLDEEIPAYMAQAISERPDFWQDLRAKMGDGDFAEVARVILAKLNDFLAGTNREYGDAFLERYVTDVAKARDLLTTAYADAMKAQGLQPTTPQPSGAQRAQRTTEPVTGQSVSGAAEPTGPIAGESGRAEVPEYGTPREGAISVLGRHYSTQQQQSLSGVFYGRGLKGAERDRLDSSPDPRLKNRIYFYVDTGAGIRPESGVGGFAHEVQLNNIYDPQSKIVKQQANLNAFESAVINAGFDGYIAPFGANQSAVVLLGMKHKAVPVAPLGRVASAAPVEKAAPSVLKKGLMSKEIDSIDTSRVPGAQLRMGNLEIPADQREAANAELQRIGSSARFSQRGAPAPAADPVAAASLAETLKLAQGQVWTRGRDLKVAMQQRVLDAAMAKGLDVTADNDDTRDYLREIGGVDALAALKQNPNAIGWYDLKTRQALSVMALVHPEIAKDPDARFAFTWALAVTSNGLKVGKNFELAEKVYEEYKRTGRMPTNIGIGTAGNAINDSLRLFNELRVSWGKDNLRKFMQTNFTVSEITGISKELTPGGEHADVTVKGAAILGPKIGNGFFSNLYGNFDALTMDRWLVRTWGRWTGTLIKPMPKQTAKARDRLGAAATAVAKDSAEAERLSKLVDLTINADVDLDALATAVQEASMDPEIRSKLNESAVGLELRKAGNSLAKYLDGQKEAPQGPTERKFIRAIFSDVLADLQQRPEYSDLTMADLQAVLWYAEKRLYETAKEDPNADEDIEGYADDDAPDYANAAASVARQKGVPDSRIKAALKKEEQNERPTGTRPAAEPSIKVPPAVAAGKPPAGGGFAGREKRQFIGERAILRARSDRASNGQQSAAFTGDGGADGGRVRVLKKLGVSYTQKWKASTPLATVFRANEIALPTFLELAPTAANAAQFQKAITDNKAALKFGAAVYVYPAEDYQGMRLFLAEDGQSGVAVKPDGDIVSVFSTAGAGRAVMELAVAAGGRKLDAFDTVLPEFYAPHGFKAVARTKWNDEFAPEGWSKEAFSEFNGGQPDVVFMVYDPAKLDADYSQKDGKVMAGDDGYDQAVARQNREMRKASKPEAAPVQAAASAKDLATVFTGLDKRGLAKSRAEAALSGRDDADQIRFIQENFLDILSELDDSGRVKINCD